MQGRVKNGDTEYSSLYKPRIKHLKKIKNDMSNHSSTEKLTDNYLTLRKDQTSDSYLR